MQPPLCLFLLLSQVSQAQQRVAVQEQFPAFLGSERIRAVVAHLEGEALEMILAQRVFGLGGIAEE